MSVRFCLSLAVIGLLTGCGVPKHMRVADGIHPKNIDKDVRYRTTYYFRTFDYCRNKKYTKDSKSIDPKSIIPETDTLYRYTLTGKANALTTKVFFESGVLDASVIDPFGAKLVHDEEGGFRVQSHKETEARARQRAARDRYQQLLIDYRNLNDESPVEGNLKADFETAIKAALNEYAGVSGSSDSVSQSLGDNPSLQAKIDGDNLNVTLNETITTTRTTQYSGKIDKEKQTAKLEKGQVDIPEGKSVPLDPSRVPVFCGNNGELTVRRGFQIMGPEGIKTFDQDDRLVMAMTIDGQPLIDTLNRYSSRVLNASASPAVALQPLVEEGLATMRAEEARQIKAGEATPPSVDVSFNAVIAAFDSDLPTETGDGEKKQ